MSDEELMKRTNLAVAEHQDTTGGNISEMTLRDAFACEALQAIICTCSDPTVSRMDEAQMAYVYADCMLEARKQ